MKVTIDANILFSALLKKGLTRKILFNPEMELYAPRFLITEFQKHSVFLIKKFAGTREEFALLCQTILSQIRFVEDKELQPFLPAAASILQDPKDWLYLACALKEDTLLWSNDHGFKKQSRVKAKTTAEMINTVGML